MRDDRAYSVLREVHTHWTPETLGKGSPAEEPADGCVCFDLRGRERSLIEGFSLGRAGSETRPTQARLVLIVPLMLVRDGLGTSSGAG